MNIHRIKRGGYSWPRVTAIHPTDGSWLIDVHGVETSPGTVVLIGFLGKSVNKQVELVNSVADGMNASVIMLDTDVVTSDVASHLAQTFAANPGVEVAVLEVNR